MISSLTRLPLEPPHADRAAQHPMHLFSEWMEAAKHTATKEPLTAFLATATRCGAPSCRVVLLNAFDEQGLVIFTNANSRKGRDMQANPQAALCFYWPETGRQLRIEGYVGNIPDTEADDDFASRPLKARIGAWASRQSEPMKDKGELARRIAYYTAKWATGKVNRPPHWTGFRIVPDYFEFCQDTPMKIPERKVFYLRESHWYTALLHP